MGPVIGLLLSDQRQRIAFMNQLNALSNRVEYYVF
jgi:hypothetical protein